MNEQTALSHEFVSLKAPLLGDDVHAATRTLARQKINEDAVALLRRSDDTSPEVTISPRNVEMNPNPP